MGRHSMDGEIPDGSEEAAVAAAMAGLDMLAEVRDALTAAGHEGVRMGWNAALDVVENAITQMRVTIVDRTCEGLLDALMLLVRDIREQSEMIPRAGERVDGS